MDASGIMIKQQIQWVATLKGVLCKSVFSFSDISTTHS
jgi:hypothetical protein